MIDIWVNKWEEIYDRGIKLNIPELAAPSPHFDFLNAIQNILPHFYTINQDLVLKQVRQNDIMEFTKLLDLFRDAKRIQQAQQGKMLGGQSAFTTSFQGEELGDTNKPEDKPSEPEPKPQNEQKPKRLRTAPKCLCGETHWFRDCPYVIPSVRKKDWTLNPEIKAKFDSATDQQKALMKRAAQQVAERLAKLKTNQPDPQPNKTKKATFSTVSALF